MRFFFVMLFVASNVSASGFDRAEALASNAKELYDMLVHVTHSLVWVLAVIPVLLMGWAVSHTMKKYKHYIGGAGENKSTIIEQMSGIVVSGVIAMTSIFFIYGIFVMTYADPSSSMTFLDAWDKLVVSFWKEVLSHA